MLHTEKRYIMFTYPVTLELQKDSVSHIKLSQVPWKSLDVLVPVQIKKHHKELYSVDLAHDVKSSYRVLIPLLTKRMFFSAFTWISTASELSASTVEFRWSQAWLV